MNPIFSPAMVADIDLERYPMHLSCMHCDGAAGHDEEVWTGHKGEDELSGFEIWLCCHACRDAGRPCETFFPIRLKSGSIFC